MAKRGLQFDDSGNDRLGEINPLAEIDPKAMIIEILNVIKHEVHRLRNKSESMLLDLQESKLLESYLRGVLAAEDGLKLGKKKITEEEAAVLSEAEIIEIIKGDKNGNS